VNPRLRARPLLIAAIAWVALWLGSCDHPAAYPADASPTREAERLYAQARELRDQLDVTRSRGASETPAGVPLAALAERYAAAYAELSRALDPGALAAAPAADARASALMRRALEQELALADPASEADAEQEPGCEYDPKRVAEGPEGGAALSQRIYACFSRAARSLWHGGEELDRLTIFGRLALSDDPAQREALWRALAPLWESVDGVAGAPSPYRTLVRKRAARLRERGEQLGESVRAIGVEPAAMESWLVSVLEMWHAITPDRPIEPWDFAHQAGRASRALQGRVPRAALRSINDRFYRELGADPIELDVQYDLAPRASKDPVAFTTFGRRPRLDGGATLAGEPWVFASYRIGGLDNLAELLHETGHAIHISAIRTRPAFADWPDSDIFTEAIADLASLEMYEPAWQQRYLGESAPLQAGIAAKYASIVMDMAWSLFELRLYREPERNPNDVWTEITQRYFRIRAHPESAWWAVRGQLIDSPGYMLNYAAGAILVADLRAELRRRQGPFDAGDPGWYKFVSESLYRFGLERPSQQVIEDFLGRPVSPRALLDDMQRASQGAQPG
jgi:hypothetical protein